MSEEKRDLAERLAIWDSPPPDPTGGNFDSEKWKWNDRRWTAALDAFPEAARRAMEAEALLERLRAALVAMRRDAMHSSSAYSSRVIKAIDDVFAGTSDAPILRIALIAEREACARIAESGGDVYGVGNCIADAIRRRGEQ